MLSLSVWDLFLPGISVLALFNFPKRNGEKFPSFQNQVAPDRNGLKNKNKIDLLRFDKVSDLKLFPMVQIHRKTARKQGSK
jgi:hypothetical protein